MSGKGRSEPSHAAPAARPPRSPAWDAPGREQLLGLVLVERQAERERGRAGVRQPEQVEQAGTAISPRLSPASDSQRLMTRSVVRRVQRGDDVRGARPARPGAASSYPPCRERIGQSSAQRAPRPALASRPGSSSRMHRRRVVQERECACSRTSVDVARHSVPRAGRACGFAIRSTAPFRCQRRGEGGHRQRLVPAAAPRAAARLRRAGLPRRDPYPPRPLARGDARGVAALRRAWPAGATCPRASARFRTAVRLAVLCHDLGHMPLSPRRPSTSPPRGRRCGCPPGWTRGEWGAGHARGLHREDPPGQPTSPSSSRSTRAARASPPEALAALITGRTPPGGSDFTYGGVDWTPLLRALVSGELDADRMDYLLRDSFYTGVNYGRYDLDWLVQNLQPGGEGRAGVPGAVPERRRSRSRTSCSAGYHMFLSVYCHHTAVNFDYMLAALLRGGARRVRDSGRPRGVPPDCDDVALLVRAPALEEPLGAAHRPAPGVQAAGPVHRAGRGLRPAGAAPRALTEAGVEHFAVESRGMLSRYFERGRGARACTSWTCRPAG